MRKKHLIKLTATHNKKKKENSKRIGIEGIFPDLPKHMYTGQLTGHRWWKTGLPPRPGTRQRSALPMLCSKCGAASLATARSREKEIKGTPVRRKERKRSLYADGMAVYIENPKESTKKPVVSSAGSWETCETNCIRMCLKWTDTEIKIQRNLQSQEKNEILRCKSNETCI